METTDASHLDEATWEKLACDELTAPERIRARTHITACPECARIDTALRALREEAKAFDPGVPADAPLPFVRPPARTAVRWLALAASLAVGVGGAAFLLRDVTPSRPGDLTVRGTLSSRPTPLTPLGAQHAPVPDFSWTAVPNARAYRVTLLDANAKPVWTSAQTDRTQLAWPAEIKTPGTYYWQVVALPMETSSELVDVTMRPAASPR